MRARILWNDLKGSPLLAVATWLFMAVSAFLFALTCFLAIGLLGSVDPLMIAAQTPDFLQMHTGAIDEAVLIPFAQEQEQVQDYQTLRFLNLENSSIILGDCSLADSTQDNGVCIQSQRFDYLVDMENRVIDEVQSGEIYVPVCYRQKYGLNAGETMRIGEVEFTIAGFLRDSQMNAMMASSKRFLVSHADYELLKSAGSEEYLIEFLLREETDVNAFATAYTDAGLPANGPAITKPLIRMMNALSDGLMILVILLVSVVLLTGILAGIASGNLLGEQLAGIFLKTLGATGFHFLIDWKAVFGWIPGVTVITIFFGGLLGLLEIKHIRAYECCMGKE